MAGSGRVPKLPVARRNKAAPRRGEWQAATVTGWQHGPIPEPPAGLLPATVTAWRTWFGAWWASHWIPADLPALELIARLHSRVEDGDVVRAAELRLSMDGYGITPKGRQDRRWLAPVESAAAPDAPTGTRYGHLRAVEGQR